MCNHEKVSVGYVESEREREGGRERQRERQREVLKQESETK